mmetsp:Transcript_120629/g.257639  ORF Transcript_120629/g.257639 Transcript_120629/m.257639 type:complete len:305 (-) Transcript_120629:177-1091(-)
MVVLRMEVLEVVVGERGDLLRITARVHTIGVVREERVHAQAVVGIVRVGVDALHFVENHTLVRQRVVLLLDFVVPALLRKDFRIVQCPWMEDGIEIDINEVVEVLEVAARHRVASPVWEGHGIEESLQARFQKLDKRLFERILSAAAEHGMLEHMRNAVGILRGGPEDNPKGLVLIGGLYHRHQLRTCAVVFEEIPCAVELLDVLDSGACPTVQLLAHLIGGRSDNRGRLCHRDPLPCYSSRGGAEMAARCRTRQQGRLQVEASQGAACCEALDLAARAAPHGGSRDSRARSGNRRHGHRRADP